MSQQVSRTLLWSCAIERSGIRLSGVVRMDGRRAYAAAAQLKADVIEDGPFEPALGAGTAPRNPVGVQLLSRPLHAQVFPPLPDNYPHAQQPPPLHPEALSLSRAHLRTHGLDPSQAAVLKPTAFTLPPLQGANLPEHFWQIGREAAQPWLSLAEEFAALQQESSYFSTSSGSKLLAPPSIGTSSSQGSLHPDDDDVGYLPPEDWLALEPSAQSLLRPRPPQWKWQSGWTMYPFLSTSISEARTIGEGIAVSHPPLDDQALVFDVETLVNAGPWPVMATALGQKGWYAWLSPWLTGESASNEHLVPFGSLTEGSQNTTAARLIVGHNVGYDRARILDEYSIERPSIRYLDTMSLHVAIRGISSPQRPAYMKKRKERQAAAEALAKEEREMKLMAKEDIKRILADTLGIEAMADDHGGSEQNHLMQLLDDDDTDHVAAEVYALFEVSEDAAAGRGSESVSARAEAAAAVTSMLRELQAKRAQVVAAAEAEAEVETSPSDIASSPEGLNAANGDGVVEWHEVTSRNSLLEVAALHCNISLDKDIRDTFVDPDSTVETLRNDWVNLLNYCASDTAATHSVLGAVLPAFRKQCPHPATFAGVLGMGSMILPVQAQQWNAYKETSEAIWKKMSDEVETALKQRAEEVMRTGVRERGRVQTTPEVSFVELDPWLKQLDWSPKKPKLRRFKAEDENGNATADFNPIDLDTPTHVTVPKWYRDAASHTRSKQGMTFRSAYAHELLQLRYAKRCILRKEDEWVAVRMTKKGKETRRVSLGSTSPFAKSFAHKEDISSASATGQEAWDALQDGREADARDALERCAWDVVDAVRRKEIVPGPQGPLADFDLAWEWVQVERTKLPFASHYELPASSSASTSKSTESAQSAWWPKWYWDIIKIPRLSASEVNATGEEQSADRGHHPFMDLSIRSKIAPLLLQLSWKGSPLFHSREHGWTYRQLPAELKTDAEGDAGSRRKPLVFKLEADQALNNETMQDGATFHKLPHASGEDANVGSPFSKSFMPYFENKTLQAGLSDKAGAGQKKGEKTPGSDAAQKAMALNTECAYWVSARDRIMNQTVVRHGQAGTAISRDSSPAGSNSDLALILPQVITMGTITRRAIERTWLTASNAKKNRVGSELKSMVKAPAGWSIVGADVDSEELWICSVMGDAQFGMHGATAVGWMTLEGTKALGTDLHSKTASILGTSRNQAKVFNYSRIYGAGIKHATQLMLKANPKLSTTEAAERAKALYRATKGLSTHRSEYFGRKFWHGGTESYVFNKLEAIALSDNPQTPALDCGITAALSREYLPKASGRDKTAVGGDYMPSRINWVVQSSGVDYLHLLISSMEHLCKKYDIAARFMLSVHDEVRYLCREEDRYRTALALQISNLWTRSMFAYKLEMDDLPQSCAFFAQVDIDHVLRKEVDDPCVTPSHPDPIPNGQALDIDGILEQTNSGSLHADGRPMEWIEPVPITAHPEIHPPYRPSHQQHRSVGPQGQYYLEAQATSDINEIRALDKRAKLEERMARQDDSAAVTANVSEHVTQKAPVAKRTRKASVTQKTATSRPIEAEEAWLDQCADSVVGDSKSRGRRSAVKPSRLSSVSSRPKASSSTGKTGSAAYSTSAMPPATEEGREVLQDIADYAAIIPTRFTVRGHGRPFFKLREHRMKVLWGLYRPILRLCPKKCLHLLKSLKERFMRRKGLVTLTATTIAMREAEWWLDRFRQAADGSRQAVALIERHELKLRRNAKLSAFRQQEEDFIDKWVNPPPIPHIMGSILRPTKDNPPLPRFKPVQPIRMTMMIQSRKRQRVRLYEHLKDVTHYRESLEFDRQAERDFLPTNADRTFAKEEEKEWQSSAGTTDAGKSGEGRAIEVDDWDKGIASELNRVWSVEHRGRQREAMKVPEKMLRKATAARRARQRVAVMLKERKAKEADEWRAGGRGRAERPTHSTTFGDGVHYPAPKRKEWWR
ncbi:DNA-directed DNA polymerase gamma mip1 [Tilletia horrida]|nr:DNA-directed DNA polymerase gamma mip1 [Tilletia horrida]